MDIIWSCLFTVFICCWRVVHPNIPPPNSQWWHRFLDRTIHLLLAAFAPEIILAVAIREYLDAKACAKRLRLDFGDGSKGWSIVHGFYICMGGFHVRYRKDHSAEVTDGWLSAVDVEDHVKRDMLKLEEVISQEEIMDKGKADWFIKCMFGFQVLWLSTQSVAEGQFNVSPSPRWRSVLSHTSHLCSSLCGFGGISHIISMSLPSSMDNLGSVALRSSLRILPNRIFRGLSRSPYRPFALARECLNVIESGAMHAPDPVRGGPSSLLFFFVGGDYIARPGISLSPRWLSSGRGESAR